MINSVRNTVLSVLNKNNYGYISPSDFNLFAKQAQIEIFEEYSFRYNNQVNKENARQSGTGYADIKGIIEEGIERFSTAASLLPKVTGSVSNYMILPEDYYKIDRVDYYPNELSSGTNTSVSAGKLVDSGATFTTDSITAGSVVTSVSTGDVAYVVSVDSDTEITLTKDIFTSTPLDYAIFSTTGIRPVDKVSQTKITLLNNSNLTAPTAAYPYYVMSESETSGFGETVAIYPSSITTSGSIITQYTRYPRDPKWTYSDVPTATGEPLFDASQPDYQDFELPEHEENTLVHKILRYAGMSIREIQMADISSRIDDRETNIER